MDPVLRASLATLAALAVLGALAALARPNPERRLERIGLLLHHGVSLGVAIAAGLCALLGGGDGRPLLLCAAGPLLVLSLQDVVSARTALLSVPLVATGLVVQALILLRLLPLAFAAPVCALAGIACTAGTVACVLRRRTIVVPRARAVILGQAVALGLVALSAFSASIPGPGGQGTWAVAIGAAGAVATACRLSPTSPPGLREVAAAFLVFALALTATAAATLDVATSFIVSAGAALASLASFVLVRATFDVARRALPLAASTTSVAERPGAELELPSPQALAAMSPLLDDALLRRPGRPRVIARVPARRLLDAALEKARSAQPSIKGRREDLLRVEVVAQETDIDVDGDPADLSEALCAVLDNALRARALHPDVKVQVQLRGSAAAVTFEISDMVPEGAEGAEPLAAMGIPDADAPFLNPRVDPDRPGLGVSLARARLLVERNGGKLLTRSSAEGSFVQVTMPRRMQKGAVGQA
jgi:signal transduction histidine kinase